MGSCSGPQRAGGDRRVTGLVTAACGPPSSGSRGGHVAERRAQAQSPRQLGSPTSTVPVPPPGRTLPPGRALGVYTCLCDWGPLQAERPPAPRGAEADPAGGPMGGSLGPSPPGRRCLLTPAGTCVSGFLQAPGLPLFALPLSRPSPPRDLGSAPCQWRPHSRPWRR